MISAKERAASSCIRCFFAFRSASARASSPRTSSNFLVNASRGDAPHRLRRALSQADIMQQSLPCPLVRVGVDRHAHFFTALSSLGTEPPPCLVPPPVRAGRFQIAEPPSHDLDKGSRLPIGVAPARRWATPAAAAHAPDRRTTALIDACSALLGNTTRAAQTPRQGVATERSAALVVWQAVRRQ